MALHISIFHVQSRNLSLVDQGLATVLVRDMYHRLLAHIRLVFLISSNDTFLPYQHTRPSLILSSPEKR